MADTPRRSPLPPTVTLPPLARGDERRLLTSAQRGSEEALETLVRRSWPLAYRSAYLVLGDVAAAEDVAQEALLAAVRSLDRFDRRRPFGPWLHRIAVNRAIDHARARAARGEVAAGGSDQIAAWIGRGTSGAGETGDRDPRLDRLGPALAQLSTEQRGLVAMRYLLDLTPGEIADELGVPRGTVNSRLRRTLDRLEAALEDRP